MTMAVVFLLGFPVENSGENCFLPLSLQRKKLQLVNSKKLHFLTLFQKMKIAISCKQSDSGLGLSLGYLGRRQKTKSTPLFSTSLLAFFFLHREWVKSVNNYLWSDHKITGSGRRLGLLEEAQDSSPQDSKEMSILRPGLNRAMKNWLPPWVGLFWTNQPLLAEQPLLS